MTFYKVFLIKFSFSSCRMKVRLERKDEDMKKQIFIVLLAIIGIGVIGFLFWGKNTSAEPLTEETAIRMVDERYGGEINNIQLINDEFHIDITLPTGKYKLKIDRSNGGVLAMEQTEAAEVEKDELTEEQIREIIKEEESGKIEKVEKKVAEDEVLYKAKIETDKKNIDLVIDAITGDIVDRQEENKPSETNKPNETNKNETDINEKVDSILTEAQAIFIALDTVDPERKGEVDDVDLETIDGQIYYFVEVEFDTDDDDDEAVVQINAITGEVGPIVWD